SKEQARKWGAGTMAAGLLFGGGILPAGTSQAAAAKPVAKAEQSQVVLKWNGSITQQTGIYSGGKVWVPVSFLRDGLNMPVSYDKADKIYSIGKGNTLTKLMVSDYGISISVNNYFLGDYEGKNINNRLYVPFDLLTDYLGYKGDWNAPSGRLNVMKQVQNAITIKTESFIKEREDAPIKLDYPQVSGLANAEAQKAINDTIKQTILKYAADAENQIANKSEDDRPYEFEGGYVVTYNQNGVLSLVTQQYGYTGGAHGMTYRNAFTFSLKDGKRLLLGDLFGANSNYKKELNAKLTKLIKADGGYLGGFTGLNTEKYFYLKEGKVVLFFQLYEYTAYAAGFPQFTFTFKEMLPDGSSPFAALK
ncbi:PdaC/SigV domain-containing protein, partial [Paenibacillus ihuae]|uniref:PdaC/SigV domain-containing protein n=1 Tax=Paenibacillus ihuae TaxID=1232431 RepID=UPI00131DD11A